MKFNLTFGKLQLSAVEYVNITANYYKLNKHNVFMRYVLVMDLAWPLGKQLSECKYTKDFITLCSSGHISYKKGICLINFFNRNTSQLIQSFNNIIWVEVGRNYVHKKHSTKYPTTTQTNNIFCSDLFCLF